MKSSDDFLSPEDRRWIVRCKVVAAVLLVGMLAAFVLDSAEGNGAAGERWYASPPAFVLCCQ